MALDKLVDSTQLDSDLTSVADAIRAKSGGSSQLAFPAGFVSEIQAIPSGGGASYTELSAVSILNDATNKYANAVVVLVVGDCKKVEILFKRLDGILTGNDIVFAKASATSAAASGTTVTGVDKSAPYFGYSSKSGVTVNTKEQVDGYTHMVVTIETAITTAFAIGAWGDSSFSHSHAFKYVKVWDTSNNLVHHFIPVADSNSEPCFFDHVNNDFHYLGTARHMVAGEAVI